jgi:hypothetical protein
VVTEYRSFTYWVMKQPNNGFALKDLELLEDLDGTKPTTITYQLNPETTYYRVFAYNGPFDVPPQ